MLKLYARLKYYVLLISDTLKAVTIFTVVLIFAMILGGIDFTPTNIALLLTLNYEPANIFDSIAQIIIMLLELSPIMAFIDTKTNTEERKSEIKAKVMKNHIILVGCGHLGKRIADFLLKFGIPFVVVVLPRDRHRNEAVINMLRQGIPVIFGDATHEETLRRANISSAKAIILSINNDVMNSVIAEKAKKLNPRIRTVVRIFNDELAEVLKANPNFDEIISTTLLSYHFFAFGAFFDVAPEELLLTIRAHKAFEGLNMKALERYGIQLVALKREGRWVRLSPDIVIRENDVLVIVGSRESMANFLKSVLSK